MTAVAPVVIECKGLWIGWSGLYDLKKTERIPEANPDDKAPTAGLLSDQVCLPPLSNVQLNAKTN